MKKRDFLKMQLLLMAVCWLALPMQAKVLRVDGSIVSEGDGGSWTTAIKTLTAALNLATSGDEIWVKTGAYSEPTYQLKEGVDVYGGFAGVETNREDRAPKTYLTYLMSGNFVDQILIGTACETLTTWDGFTFTATNNTSAGGAMVLQRNNRISNSDISYNATSANGGAIMMTDAILDRCMVSNNTSGAAGGAIRASGTSKILNSIIVNNTSNNNGGGISGTDHPVVVENCLIANNTIAATATAGNGAGIMLGDGRNGGVGRIVNCTIVRNYSGRATSSCGGVYGGGSGSNPSPFLYNCVVWGNKSEVGASNIAGFANTPGENVVDCAIERPSTSFAHPSLIRLSVVNVGSSDSVPNFVNPAPTPGIAIGEGYNYDWSFDASSPLINKGNNAHWTSSETLDLAGKTRIVGTAIDLGAYEFQGASSTSQIDSEKNIQVISHQQMITVLGAKEGEIIEVYNFNGQIVTSKPATGMDQLILNKGVFLVKVKSATVKVVL